MSERAGRRLALQYGLWRQDPRGGSAALEQQYVHAEDARRAAADRRITREGGEDSDKGEVAADVDLAGG
jgi:hypothetical protein